MNTNQKQIIILTDGRSGHETQSLGITTILNKDQVFDVKFIKIKEISKFKKIIFKFALNLFPKEWLLGQLFDVEQFGHLDIDQIAYIVSAGGDTLLPNAVLKSYLVSVGVHVKNVIATSLRGMPESAFDVVFTIDKTKLEKKPYIYYPIAPNKLLSFDLATDEKLARERLGLDQNIGVWCVLIGANSHDVSIGSVEEWIIMLEKLAQQFAADIFYVSTSRRTPKNFEQSLKNVLKQYKNIHLILVGEGDKTPIKDLMYAANMLICSPDSTSMVSESLMLGKPLFIAKFDSTDMNDEFKLFYEDKISNGWLRMGLVDGDSLFDDLKEFNYINHANSLYELFKNRLKDV
ncbi:ELM1/GtrOC1 family putative glycosyltransferase [Acinetobacter gerneri]|jgi:mitochondrial fission protein ELM1|uniref:ELM1/GtrOC1 family putative glycosyltransferase n=1 Tax=Acinetobacter gerneri TaxID=202952 RepID=UPI0023F2E9E3|nr:ELM1/GtrOC1 family putative glycosyltransferase [Acinetobacter gerneri]MCH4243109.1 mitochondrial fission ELM1 family protein [Acinetobacter gerneri]